MTSAGDKNIFLTRTVWLLAGAFLISVVVRLPDLSRPLSKHHEFCTAISLIVMQAWHDGGIASYEFNPSTTFPEKCNLNIHNYAPDFMHRDGKFYYISHPPLAYYLPYSVFFVLNIDPGVLPLQIFNLIFHFITVIFLYLTICLLTRDDATKQFSYAAFFSSLFYLFMPSTLWFHSNVYMADMFVQNTWIICLYFSLKIFLGKKERLVKLLPAFGISLFLTIYTDWLGIFYGVTVLLYCAHKTFFLRNRAYQPIMILTIAVILLSLTLIAWQYSRIDGWYTMIQYYTSDYTIRGSMGFSSVSSFLLSIKTLAVNYAVSYLPLLIFLPIIIGWMYLRRTKINIEGRNFTLFSWFTLFPVLIDHLVFLKYSGQDFTVLKASFFLCGTGGILLDQCKSSLSKLSFLKTSLVALAICISGIAIYYYINRPGDFSYKQEPYASEMKTGLFISLNSDTNEVVLVSGMDITPQIIYYAHRNILTVKNEEGGLKFLNDHSLNRAKLFYIRNDSLQFEPIHLKK